MTKETPKTNEADEQAKRDQAAAVYTARLRQAGRRVSEKRGLLIVEDPAESEYDLDGPYL